MGGTGRPRSLTGKQARFVGEYLLDLNAAGAYIRAGYRAANDQVAASCAHKLLRNAQVREAIEKAQTERRVRLDLTADDVVRSFRDLHLRALRDGDLPTAARCLENLGKHLGIFREHQKQKRYTQDDVEKLKAELTAAGFDFTRANCPSAN